MNRFLIIASLLGLVALLPSCSWLGRLFGKKPESRGVILLQVTPWFGKNTPVYAQAYDRKRGKRGDAVSTHRVAQDGSVSFVLPTGESYGVLAYADLNRNSRREKSEPTASIENLTPLSPYGSGPQYAPIILRLPGKGLPFPAASSQPAAVRSLTDEDQRRLKLLREHLPDGIRLPDSLPLPPPP